MNCPACNQAVEDGATFCGNCGQQIVAVTAPEPLEQPIQPPMPPADAAPQAPAAPAMAQPTMAPPAPLETPQQAKKPTNNKAIIGLVISVVAIVSSVIPLFGLPLAIIGLILGTVSRKSPKKILSTLAILFSVIAILSSFAWAAYSVQNYDKKTNKSNAKSYTSEPSNNSAKITTPCYTVTVPADVSFGKSGDSCTYTYKGNGKSLVIGTTYVANITTDEFKPIADSLKDSFEEEGNAVLSVQDASLAGSPARRVSLKTSNGVHGTTMLAYHDKGSGPNIYSIVYSDGSSDPNLKSIESNWQWR